MIAASQNDFEEFGVDQSTLDEMKQVCGNGPGRRASLPALSIVARTLSDSVPLSRISLLIDYFPSRYFSHRRFLRASPAGGMAAWRVLLGLAESGAELPVGLARSGGRPHYLGHFL